MITSSHSSKNEARKFLLNLIKLIDEDLTRFPYRKNFSTNKKALLISGSTLFWLTYLAISGYFVYQNGFAPQTIQVNVTNCPPDPEVCPTVPQYTEAHGRLFVTAGLSFLVGAGGLSLNIVIGGCCMDAPADVSEKDFKELIEALENTVLRNLKKQDLKGQAFRQAQAQNIINLETDIASLKQTPSVDTAIPILNQLKNTLQSILTDTNKFSELPSFLTDQEEDTASQSQINLSSISQQSSTPLLSDNDNDSDHEPNATPLTHLYSPSTRFWKTRTQKSNDDQPLLSLANDEEASDEETDEYII